MMRVGPNPHPLAGNLPTRGSGDPGDLVGEWTLTRRLVDRRAGQFGRAYGTLTIAPAGPDLRWSEVAELHWAGHIVPVTRNLHINRIEGEWWTTFTDGRPFHPWRLDEPVVHPCAADTYRGRLTLAGDELRVLWDVTGPTKQQRIITTHRRLSPASGHKTP